ncbi:MAG: M3 family metallopeptidase, partial [Woeseiaceae bacterium]
MRAMIAVSSLALIIAVYGCGQSKETAMHTAPPETAKTAVAADIGKTADALFAAIPAAAADSEEGDVLLSEYLGPYGGVPHFDTMNVAGLKSALESGMARALAEVDAIANNPEPPDFANTIIALERTSEDLNRVFTYWGIWRSNLSTPEFRDIQQEMAPRLSEFNSRITQNDALFQRVKSVYESDQSKTLPSYEQRLIWLTYDGFASDGATLKGEAKERYAAIDQRLAELYAQFGNNVLADEEGYVTYITSDQLGGLPESFAAAAKTAAEEREHPGEYAITNTRSSMDPFLTFSDERDLREKVWGTYYSRGDNGDAHDNNAIIADIVKLRDERVALLGYDNYAAWRLQNRMAKTPERAIALLEAVWPAAVGRVREEVAAMQKIADAEGADVSIKPWDYRYYMEKLRKERYALDSDEVKQYLQLNKLREAMFFVAGELFNFNFAPVPAGLVPVWHPDVKVWEVTDKTTGDHVGLWYLDPFARPGKRSGAWATGYRNYQTYNGKQTPLVSN